LRGKGRDQQTGLRTSGTAGNHVFPSPCGEKVGINMARNYFFSRHEAVPFPSPCGEKVGINSDDGGTDIIFYDLEFPSPCGEKVGINTSYQMR